MQLFLSAIHSLWYTYTAISGIENVPEFVSVGFLDGVPLVYYDSNTRRMSPRQEWMDKSVESVYWERETQISIGFQELYKINIYIAKEHFKQTGGVHTLQVIYGCEWDDESGATSGFNQFGYDGEDLLSLDLKELRWISPVQQGFITTQKWNNDRLWLEKNKHFFSTECTE
ncbi:major histocompatibility complex class I-related gene protein-like [Myxocyprinus asiaticus]|uniref:major histocompatibility complex class I-related gene protein-like n=1 Tax=Myxocyprinus asiaticus TaxID=70543 RepID=UPI0022239576|nr:major histocompatibility complex class I-related gene protein-like [Myxocyprinus asiaticus]XP_051519840.1 major histocompatibility complex class I-related gene protein-like [Myxocyprinus asiaticus]